MRCIVCGLEHRGWVSCGKAKADAVLRAICTPPFDAVLTNQDVLTAGADRHKPGYMRDYMRKRRAQPPNP